MPAQGIGELNVGVNARTAKANQNIHGFRKNVRGIRGDARSAQKSIGGLSAGLSSLRGQLIGIASIGGATLAISQSFEGIDELAKTSDKLGIATEKLAGLRFAGQQTGVEINKLDMGLQRMVRRVAEAASGTGEAQGALKELRIDAEELNRLTPDEQFLRIARAMSSVPNQAERVRLAFKLFDSEGVSLVNTLAAGEQGLKEFQRQAESLGLAVSREQAARIEKANDSINMMKSGLNGLANEAAIFVAPVVERISRAWATNFAFLSDGLDGVARVNREATSTTNQLTNATDNQTAAIERQARAIQAREATQRANIQSFKEELSQLRERRIRAQKGEDVSDYRRLLFRGINQTGRDQFFRLKDEAETAELAADQRKQLDELRKRVRDFNKSALEVERDNFLGSAIEKETAAEGQRLFSKLERLEAEKRAAEKQAREAENAEREERQARREAERNTQTVIEDKLRRGNRDNADLVDARSAQGFAALRSSVNQTDRQALMLKEAQKQTELQEGTKVAFEELNRKLEANKVQVFSMN